MPGLARHPLFYIGAVGATAAVAVAGACRAFRRVEVEGASMVPTLAPGDRLLVVRRRHVPGPGALVAVADPRPAPGAPGGPRRLLIKRLTSVTPTGWLVVQGDAPGASTDSREFGPVPPGLLVGEAVYRYAPLAHSGWLRRPGRRQHGAARSVA